MVAHNPVVIIDDTEANRYAVSHILKKAGYTTYEATNAREGQALIFSVNPDLIILDVKLPDKNGFILCSELKAAPYTTSIPILLTSASFVDGRDKAYGLDSGADGYLTTPIDPLELVATVRSLLRIRDAERNLKASDDRLRLMIESVKDYAFFSINTEGQVSTWNTGAERMFGYLESEIMGRDASVLFTPEDREKDIFRRELEQSKVAGQSENERWYMRKDGQRFFAAGITSCMYDSEEHLIGYTRVARDITERREHEEKLKKSQELFRTLANSVPAMVWMANNTMRCYYFNQAWLDFSGMGLDENIERGGKESRIHPDDLPGYEAVYSNAFAAQHSFEATHRLLRYDGAYRWVLDRGEPHYSLEGGFLGYTGACIDIHDKLMAENRLQESEERFDLAMQGMNDGLYDYNPVTQDVYYSPRYKAQLGYRDDEYENHIGMIDQNIHPDDHESVWKQVNDAISTKGNDYKNLFRMRHKDGTYRWIMSRGLIVRDEQGQAIRIVGAHTDITEQKDLEKQLRDSYTKAEAANLAKSEFLANMSHEIRTPMNAIIGLANILATTPLNEKQKQFMTTLQLSAESLLSLLNDLLDISKIEDNMITLESVPFNLRDLLTRVMTMMSVKADEKQLSMEIDYAPDAWDAFMGDPLRLQQILVNLIGNALKFTAKGGLVIEVVQAYHDDTKESADVTIHVHDTGIGIPENKLKSIFEKFTQADNSTTRQYGGTGLGLTICKALIERMGGAISVTSESEKGSTFTISLPLDLDTNVPDLDANPEIMKKADKNSAVNLGQILLVEDYLPNILVATTILEKLGYRYVTAKNGPEAIEYVKHNTFYAILMDVQMQGMDGFETTRYIRNWELEHKKDPSFIIAMTAHALIGDREKCIEAGMNDYLSKPFNPDELKTKLADLKDHGLTA